MKAFLGGVAALAVLTLAAGVAYDLLAVETAASGFARNPAVHLHSG